MAKKGAAFSLLGGQLVEGEAILVALQQELALCVAQPHIEIAAHILTCIFLSFNLSQVLLCIFELSLQNVVLVSQLVNLTLRVLKFGLKSRFALRGLLKL